MFNTGFRGKRAGDGTGIINPQEQFVQNKYPVPTISSWSISGSDDTALNPAGGQTVLVNGGGFAAGCAVTVNGVTITPVTVISPNQISFTSTALAGGSYTLIVYNSEGGGAILVPGLVYSSVPTYTTAQGSIGSGYETKAISTSVTATSDSSITYAITSGALPSGASMTSGGVITGTYPTLSVGTSETFYFDITATDAENQDVTRSFTLTTNIDVVTWVTPSSGATINLDGTAYSQSLSATDAAGYAVSYSANALPTGLTLSSGTISGTPTVDGTSSTLLTATAATTNRTGTNTITWVVALSDAYFKYTSLLLSANSSIQTQSFVADNSINNNQLTVYNDVKATDFNPYQPGYYGANFTATANYLTTSNAAFNISSASIAWTIEMWVCPFTSGYLFCIGGGGSYDNGIAMDWGLQNANKFTFMQGTGSGSNINNITTSNTFLAGKWYHFAVSKNSAGVIRLFVNGVQENTVTNTSTAVSAGTTAVINGAYDNNGLGNNGGARIISNLRFVKGYAVYTSAFTPTTTPLQPIAGTLLLACQQNRFIDSSDMNLALTVGGTPTVTMSNPFTTEYVADTQYYSTNFDGTSDYLNVVPGTFGSANFTIEFWYYSNVTTGQVFFNNVNWYGGLTPGSIMIWHDGSSFYFNTYTGGGSDNGYAPGVTITRTLPSANTWHHVALSRDGGTMYAAIDGVVTSGTLTSNTGLNLESRTTYTIGGWNGNAGGPAYWMSGNISNFRIVKGSALYTSNFTPSTTPLTAVSGTSLLTCKDSTIRDESTDNRTISVNGNATQKAVSPLIPTYYSNQFNGSTDYLTFPTNTGYDFGTGDFTIECWINPSAITSNRVFMSTQTNGSSSAGWSLFLFSSGYIGFDVFEGSEKYVTCSTTQLTVGNWYHVAFTRQSGTLRIFVNGVSQTFSGTQASSINSAVGLTIGRQQQAGYEYAFTGYISNARVIKGTSLYNAGFTPSTSPLTAVSGTVALTCQSLYFIDNSSNHFTITQNGTPKIAAVAPFTQPTNYTSTQIPTTYGSSYFDGTGDYLTVPVTQGLGFGTNSFTWECWLYPTSTASYFTIYDTSAAGDTGGTGRILIDHQSGGYLRVYTDAGTSQLLISPAAAIKANQWHHLVISRSGTTGYLFVNGAMLNTNTVSTNFKAVTASGTNRPIIFANGYDASTAFIGYMADMRVINGTCLYNSSFVPNITPLTNVDKTQLLISQTSGSHNNTTFKDSSRFNNVITKIGNSTNGTFSPYGDNWSVHYPAAAYTTIAASPFTFGTGANFTVEAWINITSLPGAGYYFSVFGSCDQSTLLYWHCGFEPSGKLSIQWYDGNSKVALSTSTLALNTWYHVAYVATSGSLKMFLNGNLETLTGTTTLTNPTGNASYTTGSERGNHGAAAYVSNLRINNTALYSNSFSVPTSPYTPNATNGLLTAQSNRFIDNSVNNRTITISNASIQKYSPFSTLIVPKYYSTQYNIANADGYLNVNHASNLVIGTNPFTIECWINITQWVSGAAIIANKRVYNSTGTGSWILYVTTAGAVALDQLQTPANIVTTASGVISSGTWYHIAVSRDASNVVRLFVNGNNVGTTSPTSTFNFSESSNVLMIGKNNDSAGYRFIGYMSNFRFVNGTGLYTTTFTPSTTPLTAVTNTVFLNNGNSLEDISSYANVVKQVGTALVQLQYGPPTFQTPTVVSGLNYSPSTFGSSMYFDGTGDYLTAPNTRAFDLSAGQWTIECWFYQIAPKQVQLFSVSAASWRLAVDASGGAGFTFNSTSTTSYPAGSFPARQWNHISATFSNDGTTSAQRSYANGKLIATGQYWPNADTSSLFYIGNNKDAAGAWDFNGFMTDVLIIKGSNYDASFFPRTTPAQVTSNTTLLVNGTTTGVLDATRTVDLETVAEAKVTPFSPYNGTYYSNYFDGNDTRLSVTAGTAFNMGSGDFSIEMWVNPVSSSTYGALLTFDAADYPLCIYYGTGVNSGNIMAAAGTGSAWFTNTSAMTFGTTVAGVWSHILLTRSGDSWRCFQDGVLRYYATQSGTVGDSSGNIYIGANGSTIYRVTAYISNLRIIKGSVPTGYQTSSTTVGATIFTPSTSPLTTTSQGATSANVSLLTCQNNKFIDNSTNNFTITNVNNGIKINTRNPFQVNTGQSYYFDGTGDYLALREDTALWGFGTSDFTIEAWVNPFARAANGSYIIGRSQYGVGSDWAFWINNSGTLQFYMLTGGAGNIVVSTGTVPLYTWTHVAVVRSGTNVRLYINGTLDGEKTGYSSSLTTSYGPTVIGNSSNNTGSVYFNGYIADLRVTRGYARTISVPSTPYKTN